MIKNNFNNKQINNKSRRCVAAFPARWRKLRTQVLPSRGDRKPVIKTKYINLIKRVENDVRANDKYQQDHPVNFFF